MRYLIQVFPVYFLLSGCGAKAPENKGLASSPDVSGPFIIVLGTLQDGGSPHAGCAKSCCRDLYRRPDPQRKIISLGLIDPFSGKSWLFEASPDLPSQIFELNAAAGRDRNRAPEGIFISHAHIGHYAGLMYLGREAMNTKRTMVYAMPRLKKFVETNGPWSQLVTLQNIVLDPLENERTVTLVPGISVKPFLVPHRDEYSETVGFIIEGPSKKVLFIPDIDKWSKWSRNIEDEIRQVDVVFIDGTFYDGREINNRDISEIPHPFVSESMERFKGMDPKEKEKVHFIHLNHTNPLLVKDSPEAKAVQDAGFRTASHGQKIFL